MAKRKYRKIKAVNCPAFDQERIAFNSKGFNHLFYKGNRSERDFKDIQTRVRLLERAVILLKKTTVYQEENLYKIKDKGRSKTIYFWAFEGVINDRRIKAVVRQIGRGKKHFWSVIPAWRPARPGKKIKNYRVNPAKY